MQNHLFVPMCLEALCVTTRMLVPEEQKWAVQYDRLADLDSPEAPHYHPLPGESGRPPGVYLSWTLPPGLRSAREQPDGTLAFEKIPNRYLVLRQQRLADGTCAAMAWLLLADGAGGGRFDPEPVRAASAFLDPQSGAAPQSLLIGIAVPAHRYAPQRHRSAFGDAAGRYALDAGGCGNPAFTVFTPHNRNILSFYDPVAHEHIADGAVPTAQQRIERASLRYSVLGWYDDAALEPLAGREGAALAARLAQLGWNPEPGLAGPARVLVGASLDALAWERDGQPDDARPAGADVKIAFAPSLMEGLDVLLEAHGAAPATAGFAELLHRQTALAPPALARERHQRGFASLAGERRYWLAQRDEAAAGPAARRRRSRRRPPWRRWPHCRRRKRGAPRWRWNASAGGARARTSTGAAPCSTASASGRRSRSGKTTGRSWSPGSNCRRRRCAPMAPPPTARWRRPDRRWRRPSRRCWPASIRAWPCANRAPAATTKARTRCC
ncbi:hypothetical protein HF313_16665 [Massilia atriviolacea]|uniref:hypothetical protein n=1 Tax=Massilia atriviolacea TaxID=2495579 RepID=UPI0038577DBB